MRPRTQVEPSPHPAQHATEGRCMKSSSLSLPPSVRAAAETVLGGGAIREEFAWMSWAGTVWRLTVDAGGVIFVMLSADLTVERDHLGWTAGLCPVPLS